MGWDRAGAGGRGEPGKEGGGFLFREENFLFEWFSFVVELS
jgi:hypothetical protein